MDKKKIFLVSLGHLSCDINGGAVPASLPYLRSIYGFDYQAAGGLVLAYSCLSSLIQPLLGLLSDRLQKPWFIPLGIVLAGLGVTMMGFMSNYWAIFAAIAISGIGSAFFHPEGAKFANKVAGHNKGVALSLFSIGGNSGFILGPILIAFFVGHFGMHGTAIFAIIALLTAAIMIRQIAGLKPAGKAHVPHAEAGRSASGLAEDPAGAEAEELDEEDSQNAKNNWPQFLRLMGVIITRSVVFAGCNAFIPLYFVNVFAQSNTMGAMALVVFGICGVGLNMLGGFMADRLGCVPVIRLAFSIMPIAVLAFGLAPNITMAYCVLPFLAFVIYAPFSSQVVLGQKLLARNIGFASGVTLGLATTLGGIAQPALGFIADTFGLHAIFFCLAGFSLTGCSFSWILARKQA